MKPTSDMVKDLENEKDYRRGRLTSWKKDNKPKYKVWQIVEVKYDDGRGNILDNIVIIANIGIETEDWNGQTLDYPRYVYKCIAKDRKGDGPPSPFYDNEIMNIVGEISA